MEDMGNNPAREGATCGHVPPGADERTSRATVNDKYAAKHNPFVYFHSIIDEQSPVRFACREPGQTAHRSAQRGNDAQLFIHHSQSL